MPGTLKVCEAANQKLISRNHMPEKHSPVGEKGPALSNHGLSRLVRHKQSGLSLFPLIVHQAFVIGIYGRKERKIILNILFGSKGIFGQKNGELCLGA